MDVIDALARLAAAEQELLATLCEVFPVGSTLSLDIGTPATPHVLRGQVMGSKTDIGVHQQLALAVQIGGQGPARLWPLPLGMEQADSVQATGK